MTTSEQAAPRPHEHSPTPMRRLSLVIGGTWSGGILSNAIFAFVDASDAAKLAVNLSLLVVGAIAGFFAGREADPWQPGDLRDGPGGVAMLAAAVLGIALAIVLPSPGAIIAGVVALAAAAVFVLPPYVGRGTPR